LKYYLKINHSYFYTNSLRKPRIKLPERRKGSAGSRSITLQFCLTQNTDWEVYKTGRLFEGTVLERMLKRALRRIREALWRIRQALWTMRQALWRMRQAL
jgi:hypothetical protein